MVIWNVVGYEMCRRRNTSYTKKLIPIIHCNLINVKISISWKHPSNNVSYKILIMVHLLLPFYEKGCFLIFQFSKLIYVLGISLLSHVFNIYELQRLMNHLIPFNILELKYFLILHIATNTW